ncbi:hydrogenase, partial [Escherichia coli]|nr:hydrogenase [Escherichia coli]
KTSFLKNIILKIVFFLIIEWTQLSPKNTVRFLFLVRMPL